MIADSLSIFVANGFLACLPGNGFVKHWNAIFLELWRDRVSCEGLGSHPLVRDFKRQKSPNDRLKSIGSTASREYVDDYVAHMLASSRLLRIVDPVTGFSGPEYFKNHCRTFTLNQIFPLHTVFDDPGGFTERQHFEILQLQRLPGSTEQAQVDARQLIEGMFARGILKKFSHGLNGTEWAAASLDKISDADSRPGTWGEYLRWATIHIVSEVPKPTKPGTGKIPLISGIRRAEITQVIDGDAAGSSCCKDSSLGMSQGIR